MLKTRKSKYTAAFLMFLVLSLLISINGSAAIGIYGEIETTPKQQYNYVPDNVAYTDSIYTLEYEYKVSGVKGSGSK